MTDKKHVNTNTRLEDPAQPGLIWQCVATDGEQRILHCRGALLSRTTEQLQGWLFLAGTGRGYERDPMKSAAPLAAFAAGTYV